MCLSIESPAMLFAKTDLFIHNDVNAKDILYAHRNKLSSLNGYRNIFIETNPMAENTYRKCQQLETRSKSFTVATSQRNGSFLSKCVHASRIMSSNMRRYESHCRIIRDTAYSNVAIESNAKTKQTYPTIQFSSLKHEISNIGQMEAANACQQSPTGETTTAARRHPSAHRRGGTCNREL